MPQLEKMCEQRNGRNEKFAECEDAFMAENLMRFSHFLTMMNAIRNARNALGGSLGVK